jgi:hypothetical protein
MLPSGAAIGVVIGVVMLGLAGPEPEPGTDNEPMDPNELSDSTGGPPVTGTVTPTVDSSVVVESLAEERDGAPARCTSSV